MNQRFYGQFILAQWWRVVAAVCGLLLVAPSQARVLKWGSSSWNQARLLPPGEQKVTFKVQTLKTSTELSKGGVPVPAGRAYGYTTRFSDLIDRSGNKEGLEIRSLLKKQGISESTPVYTTEFSMETTEVQSEITWSRGLTPFWMVGISIPYIQSSTKVQSAQRLDPEYKRLKDKLKAHNTEKPIDTFVEKGRLQSLELDLEENDYDQVSGTVEYQGLGDVELLSQIQLLETHRLYVSFRQRLVVPSGKNEGPFTYFKSNSADGQIDVGADALLDIQAAQGWVLTALLGYTMQTADTQAARVPDENSSPMDWKVDNNVERDLGDIFIARLSSVYQLFEQYWMTAGLEVTQKTKDEYSGPEYEPWQYDLMEKNTEEQRQLARFGVRYTSRTWSYNDFSRTYFTAGLEYLTVFAGENTPKANAAALELSLSY